MRMILSALGALLIIGCAGLTPQHLSSTSPSAAAARSIPSDLSDEIARSQAIDRTLYVLDKVAAIGTDVLFENVKGPPKLPMSGYIPVREGTEEGGWRFNYVPRR